MDTTRADHLGSYGYAHETSPRLDRFAGDGVRFERAYAHAPVTLPSHTSMMSGRFPVHHGVRDNGRFVVPPENQTLAEIVSESGYETGAFVSAFVLDSRYGLGQGFDHYDDDFARDWSEEDLRDRQLYSQMVVDRPADQTVDRALEWLAKRPRDQPLFLWLHLYDPHQRYAPPEAFLRQHPNRPYDGEIAFMDSQIGRFLDALRAAGRYDTSLIIASADHGEALGEHGELTHAILAFDATLRVPLMVKLPRSSARWRGVASDPVSHVDLLPTVADYLGLALPEDPLPGRSLRPLLEGGSLAPTDSYFESLLPRFAYGWASLFGVRRGSDKLIFGPRPAYYDLAGDPNETRPLPALESDVGTDLSRRLFRLIDRYPTLGSGPSADMGEDVRRQLEALGYAGGSAGAATELTPRVEATRPDPGQRTFLLYDYHVARSLAAGGRYADAAGIYRQILLPLEPDNAGFAYDLANLLRLAGEAEESRRFFLRAQALDPDNLETLLALAQLESDGGRWAEADALLNAAQALSPGLVRVHYLQGWSYRQRGDLVAAEAAFNRALEVDPSHLDSRNHRGLVRAELGRLAEALDDFERATAASPLDPRYRYNLGLAQARSGRVEEAVEQWQLVVSQSPDYEPVVEALRWARDPATGAPPVVGEEGVSRAESR